MPHPALIGDDILEFVDEHFGSVTVAERFDYQPGWCNVARTVCLAEAD